ncbi:MAG: stage II sporulation protein M [Halanaerobiaceae bacterium]|nr:stage II sporulation protein M [Halanaerobiaceae bacterium]
MNRYIRERLPAFTFVTIIFILGISFGAIAVKTVDYELRQDLFFYFNGFLDGFTEIEYEQSSLLADSIRFNLFNIFVIWSFGLSMILMPLIIVFLFFKGFLLGFTVGFLVSEYSFKGILMSLAAVFPQNLLIIPVYLISTVMAIYLSLSIYKYYRGRARIELEDLVVYTLEMAILALILLLASLLETYLSPFLLRFLIAFIL